MQLASKCKEMVPAHNMEFCLRFENWEDGEKVSKALTAPDRWAVHQAEEVEVTLGPLCIRVIQKPTSITAKKIGVGACLWDGALLLAAYLVSQPHYKYVGMRCVELGAGVGLVGLALAMLGAQVVITDIEKVMSLLQDNLIANGFDPARGPQPGKGWAEGLELEWGKEGWMDTVRALADPPPDLVLAADCCYVDQDGKSPSTPDFVTTCAGLCGPNTKCLVAFERRSPEVRRCLLEEAHKKFSRVRQVPLSQYPKPLQHLEFCDIWELQL